MISFRALRVFGNWVILNRKLIVKVNTEFRPRDAVLVSLLLRRISYDCG